MGARENYDKVATSIADRKQTSALPLKTKTFRMVTPVGKLMPRAALRSGVAPFRTRRVAAVHRDGTETGARR